MNLKTIKSLFILISIFISTQTAWGKEIHFDDQLLLAAQDEHCAVAASKTRIYVIQGKFHDMKAGECLTVSTKEVDVFSIAELVSMNPELRTLRTLKAALKQQHHFKHHKSELFNEDIQL